MVALSSQDWARLPCEPAREDVAMDAITDRVLRQHADPELAE